MNLFSLPIDVSSGVTQAKTTVISTAKPVVNNAVVPLMDLVAVGFLLFFIVGLVNRHRAGEEYTGKIVGIIVCLVAITLVTSFPQWGWSLAGV